MRLIFSFFIFGMSLNVWSQPNCSEIERFYTGFQFDTMVVRPAVTPTINSTSINIEWVNYYHKTNQLDSSLWFIKQWKENSKGLEKIKVTILLGERFQFNAEWDSAAILFQEVYKASNSNDTLKLYARYNILKLQSKLNLESFEWMKSEVVEIWNKAKELNEELLMSDMVPIALAYEAIDLEQLNQVKWKNRIARGRLSYHLAYNNRNRLQVDDFLEVQQQVASCDPLYKFKAIVLEVDHRLRKQINDTILTLLNTNESYCRVLNDQEVWRHLYQLYERYYHLSGQESKRLLYAEKIQGIQERFNYLDRRDEFRDKINNQLTSFNKKLEERNMFLLILVVALCFLVLIVLLLIWRLYKQRTQLKATNSQLNQLFQIIAHDIQSPLSYTISLSNQEGINKSEIGESLLDLRDMTNSILTWASKNLEGIKFRKQTVDILAIIRTELEHYDHTINSKNLKLFLNGEAECITDPSLMAIIIRNVLDNAIKYSPNEGEIKVDLSNNEVKVKNNVDVKATSGTQQGMILIQSIAKSIGLKIETKSTGSMFELKLRF